MLFKSICHNNSDVKYMKMYFLQLTVRKILDYYLKLTSGWTPDWPHFSWVLLTETQVKQKIVKINAENVTVDLYPMTLKKIIKGYETLTNTL